MDVFDLVCHSPNCYRGIVAFGWCDTHYRTQLRKLRPLYQTWLNIKQWCYNRGNASYPLYGAKGIIVCERWRKNYYAFALDMGERPEGTVLERLDDTLNFAPSNCHWVARKKTHANTR